MTNVSRVGPFNASSVWVLPVSDPTYVAYRGRRPAARSGAVVVPPEARWWEPAAAPARYAYGPDWTSRVVFGRFPLEVVSLVMSRKMMLNINRLADRET